MRNGDRIDNAVKTCLSFFALAVPEPNKKNFTTQLGCHFEEVHEHLLEITALEPDAEFFLANAREAVHRLAEHLKSRGGVSVRPSDSVAFLDALCDQMVTAIGTAYMINMDIENAFDEVNRSNLSKFGPDGYPIFNADMKVLKGPFYTPAELSTYV